MNANLRRAESIADTSWYNPDRTEFTISTVEQLAGLARIVNRPNSVNSPAGGPPFGGKTIRLAADINLAGIEWTPIGDGSAAFGGTFDGGGHTIANLTITEKSVYAGLFGVSTGIVRGIRLINVNINVSSSCGNDSYAGGLVGWDDGRIEGCTANGKNISTITEKDCAYIGGFIGKANPGSFLTNNRDETGVSPAIGVHEKKDRSGPSNNIGLQSKPMGTT
jgi:hypothetical protein